MSTHSILAIQEFDTDHKTTRLLIVFRVRHNSDQVIFLSVNDGDWNHLSWFKTFTLNDHRSIDFRRVSEGSANEHAVFTLSRAIDDAVEFIVDHFLAPVERNPASAGGTPVDPPGAAVLFTLQPQLHCSHCNRIVTLQPQRRYPVPQWRCLHGTDNYTLDAAASQLRECKDG